MQQTASRFHHFLDKFYEFLPKILLQKRDVSNDWLTDWLADWLSDWLADWLTENCRINSVPLQSALRTAQTNFRKQTDTKH
jgi:hypothetical protein